MNEKAERFLAYYIDVHSRAGLLPVQAGPLYRQDGHTVFSSCTVSNYRGALSGRTFEPGTVMVQRCFRARGLGGLHSAERGPRRSLFDMYGGYVSTDEQCVGERVALHAALAQEALALSGVGERDVVFMGDRGVLGRWGERAGRYLNVRAYEDASPENGLPSRGGRRTKRYGGGVTGAGLEVWARAQGGPWALAGNIVVTLGPTGAVTGVDFGGGLEATTLAMHGPAGAYLDDEMMWRFGIRSEESRHPRFLNLLEALQGLLIVLANERRPHPLSSTQHGTHAAARSVLVQREILELSADEMRGLAVTWTETQRLEREVAERALLILRKRHESVQAVLARADRGALGRWLDRRQAQAQRQGHVFDHAKKAASILRSYERLPPTSRGGLPPLLSAEELAVVEHARQAPR